MIPYFQCRSFHYNYVRVVFGTGSLLVKSINNAKTVQLSSLEPHRRGGNSTDHLLDQVMWFEKLPSR